MKLFEETKVSFFKAYKKDNAWIPGNRPIHKTLHEVLTTDWQPSLTAAIKAESDKSKRDALKMQLYSITPSAITRYGHKETDLVFHTGLLQFDIDYLKQTEISRYKAIVKAIPYIAYLAESASGRGLWGLVRISEPEKHSEHYDALRILFKSINIGIDTAPQNVCSLRFVSYDPCAYYNPEAPVFSNLASKENKVKERVTRKVALNNDRSTDQNLIQWFNLNCTGDDIMEILENYGFCEHSVVGDRIRFTRPGKEVSAGLSLDYHAEKRTLYCFSSSVDGLKHWKKEKKTGWSCSPVTALLLYGLGGFKKKHWGKAFAYIKDKM